jgi:hypothetical protein
MTGISVVFAIGAAVGFAVGYAVRAATAQRHPTPIGHTLLEVLEHSPLRACMETAFFFTPSI